MVVRLWLNMLWMTHVAAKTNVVTVILFSCHCCRLSNADSWYLHCFSVIVAHRVWVNGIAMSMNAAYLFVESTNIMSGQLKCTVLFIHKSQFQFSLWVSFSRTTCDSYLWCGKHGSL